MNSILKFSAILGASALLASCSNYGYISENDVYMQAPTEINLDENEDDITSFNAFKARQKGAFDQEYKDPRVNEQMRFNQIMIINAYQPFGTSNYMYRNGPMAFHGMGMHNPYGYGYGYNGFNSGWGHGMSYGYSPFYYNQMDPFGYGFGYGYNGLYSGLYYGNGFGNNYYGNSYYGNGYYGGGYYGHSYYGNGYYGNGYYNNGVNNNNSNSSSQPTYYGNRSSMSSSSNRSSYNPSKAMMTTDTKESFNVNNQSLGDSRRDVQRRSAGSSDYKSTNDKFNKNGVPIQNGINTNRNTQINNSPAHHRAVNNSYTPNSSARRSGVVQEQRQVGSSVEINRRVSPTRSTGTINSQSTRSSSPSIQTTQPRQGSMSTSPSGSGSSRGSSSSSSSSSRRQ